MPEKVVLMQINPQVGTSELVTAAEKSLEGNYLVRYEIHFPDDQRTLGVLPKNN